MSIDELDAADIAAIDVAELHKLDDPGLDVPTITDAMRAVIGGAPRLQIDVSDPPSPVIAEVAGVAVEAASADSGLRDLGTAVSDALHARADELGVALATPADQGPV